MRRPSIIAAIIVLLCLWVTTAGAETYPNRFWHDYNPDPPPNQPQGYYTYDPIQIAGNAVWTAANGPYILQNMVTVATGATLTIEPGTVVQVAGAFRLHVDGTLSATGATFTGPAHWLGIYLSPTSGGSTLNGCVVENAGAHNAGYGLRVNAHGYWEVTAIYIDSSSPQITNCTIRNSETHGISLYASRATLTGNSFESMGESYYPVSLDTTNSFPTMSGNTTSGTGYNGVGLKGGDLSSSGTWTRAGVSFPYLTRGSINIPAGLALAIDPGVTVKANGADALYVNGNLTASGTAQLPVTFSSRSATPAAGDWRGIYLAPTATASSFSHVTINYAGGYFAGFGLYVNVHGDWVKAALYLDGVSPPLTAVSILNSQTNGLEMYDATPTIANGAFSNCGWSGLKAGGASRPVLNTASFSANGAGGYYAVSLDASSVPNPNAVTFSGNSYQGVQIRGGELPASALWKNWSANAPYAVTGDVTVNAGVTLTIEPTTAVKFWKTGLYVYGTLNANSTTGRIAFTSLADDAVGGDTNGDASAQAPSVPTAGDWKGIYLSPASGASLLANCDFDYSGFHNAGYGLRVNAHGYWEVTAIYIDSSAPQISNCRIRNSQTHGISLYASQATLAGNSFENMGGSYYPVSLDTSNCFPTMSGNTTSGTGYNGVGLIGGDLSSSGTWDRAGASFPYLTRGSITIPEGLALAIDPGVTVKANGADGIYVNGNLTASGTAQLPVTFSSRSATPAAGDWRGIYLAPTATASSFSHVAISYAGGYFAGYGLYVNVHGDWVKAALYLDGVSPPLTAVSILNSQTNGLEMYGAAPTIANGVFSNCGWSGLKAGGASRPVLNTASFSANGAGGYYAVSLDASSVPNPNAVTFSGNSYQGVQIRGGALPASALWKNWSANAPYAVTGDVTVNAGVTLTVEPTTTVKLSGVGLYVNGALNANSTTGRITFTSLADDSIGGDTNGDASAPAPSVPAAGNWKGIYLSPASGASVLANCSIKFSGAYASGYGLNVQPHGAWVMAALYVDDSNPAITGCQFLNSETHGLRLWSSTATLTGNVFQDMGSDRYPILFDTLDSYPAMSGNATSGTGYNGIGLPAGEIAVSGVWKRPGAGFPYLMNGPLRLKEGISLTIDPGNTVKSNFDGIYVYGTLSAAGTQALPITFTSRAATPVPGSWRGIYLAPSATVTAMSHVTIDYAGAYSGGYGLNVQPHGDWVKAALYLDGISPQLAWVSILNSETNGLEMYGASPVITNSRLENCGWSQLSATGGSQPTVSATRFFGASANNGLITTTPAQVIVARNNYWGSPAGPTHASNPAGSGVKVSDGVDFGSLRTGSGYILTITFAGTGDGNVTSIPSGVSATNTWSGYQPEGTAYTLKATGDANSLFGGWSGACAGGADCSVTMIEDLSTTATFTLVGAARIQGPTPQYFATFMAAYNAAPTGSLIQMREYTFVGNALLTRPVKLKVGGGYDKTYTTHAGVSKIKGILTIRTGSLTVDGLVIQ